MKFSEIIEPPGGYINTTHSYFLVLGIFDRGYPNPTGTGNFESRNGSLIDINQNTVDVFYDIIIQVEQWTDSMTVWNGTAMESEPITHTTSTSIIIEKKEMLIPPGFKLLSFGYAIGFWLTAEEVEEYVKGHFSESSVSQEQ